MKKLKDSRIALAVSLIALVFSLFIFAIAPVQVIKHLAEPKQLQGIVVYSRCTPVDEYTFIGNYKIKLSWDEKPETLFDQLVKKSKEKFPDEQAIIISDDMQSCDCVKFK